ncbi:MAG TPA: AIR synthase-related protein, partial [Dehalococcoidia bacterium]
MTGIQDLGAAGLSASSAESASRAGTGLLIDVAKVPRREDGMTPYEVMLSESQERMLIIVRQGHEDDVAGLFERWEVPWAIIGHVTDDGMIRILDRDREAAALPVGILVEAPEYTREGIRPQELDNMEALDLLALPDLAGAGLASSPHPAVGLPQPVNGQHTPEVDPKPAPTALASPNAVLLHLLASPNIASKRWIYRQYDQSVLSNTVLEAGSDAAVMRIKGTNKGIALTTDGNGRYCHINPYAGGAMAVAEAARNVVCSGAQPVAVTDCLNFGNPERPEVYYQMEEVIRGIAHACDELGTPVISGNVSLYNETEGRAIYPTPVIGMLGLIEDARHTTTEWFKEAGDAILLLGLTRNDLGASELLSVVAGEASGAVPRLDLEAEKAVQKVCLEAIQSGLVRSAHDCSDGGLAVALAESCFSSYGRDAIGARIDLSEHGKSSGLRLSPALLFGESPSRIVISLKPEHVSEVKEIARRVGVICAVIGETGGEELIVARDGESLIAASVASLEEAWRGALSSHLDRPIQIAP